MNMIPYTPKLCKCNYFVNDIVIVIAKMFQNICLRWSKYTSISERDFPLKFEFLLNFSLTVISILKKYFQLKGNNSPAKHPKKKYKKNVQILKWNKKF